MFDGNLYIFSCVFLLNALAMSVYTSVRIPCVVVERSSIGILISICDLADCDQWCAIEHPCRAAIENAVIMKTRFASRSMSKSQKASIVQSGWCCTMFGPLAHYNKYKPNDYRYAMIKINGEKNLKPNEITKGNALKNGRHNNRSIFSKIKS